MKTEPKWRTGKWVEKRLKYQNTDVGFDNGEVVLDNGHRIWQLKSGHWCIVVGEYLPNEPGKIALAPFDTREDAIAMGHLVEAP